MESIYRIKYFPSAPVSFPYVVNSVDRQMWCDAGSQLRLYVVNGARAEVLEIHVSDTNTSPLDLTSCMIGAAVPSIFGGL